MSFSLDVLLLAFGLAGFAALLGGCLVVAVYLLCSILAARPLSRNSPDDSLAGSPAGAPWSIHLLVVLLGGAVLAGESVIWLWHAVSPAHAVLIVAAAPVADTGPSRINLFPWE
jgi:hypothetical protein